MRALASLLLVAACTGNGGGTLTVSIATAPGSHVMDDVQTLRLVVTNPHQVTTATRDGGFAIELDLDTTTGVSGALIIDGLDASGTIIATGASPTFPISTLNAHIAVYMAAPNTIAAAPVDLGVARDQLGVAQLVYGAVIAGGRDAAGVPSSAIGIYNAFDHTLIDGVPLVAPRAGIAVAGGATQYVYFFGGRDASGQPAANLWRFDTSTGTAGAIIDIGAKPGFERADQTELPIGNEHFLITGTPGAELSALDGSVTARGEVPSLPASAAAVTGSDGVAAAIFAGSDGVVRFRNNTFDTLAIPIAARADATVSALAGGKVLVACGAGAAVRIDAATGAAEMFPAIPSEARTGCAVASTTRHVVIAGGVLASTGQVATTAEIYDAATLALVATVPLVVPRTGAHAVPLSNDQILISSGLDAAGAPTATLELFTPESLE